MSVPGIDYSFSRPAAAEIKAAGFKFVVRYLFPDGKGMSRGEAASLAAEGLWIVSVYEGSAEWMLGGSSAGAAAAHQSLILGDSIGMPQGRPVFFGADFDASESQLSAIDECLNGAASVLGRDAVGIYGGILAVRHAMEAGSASWGYQTLAWSGGQWYPAARVRQTGINHFVSGQSVDLDEAIAADYGQWQPGKVPLHKPPGGTVIEHVTAGKQSLNGLAEQHKVEPSAILRLTAEHSPHSVFPGNVAHYINEVFSGKLDPGADMPAGLHLYLPHP